MNEPTHTEWVYGNLLVAFMQAVRKEDKAKADRIDAAILVFEELWPEDCRRWRERSGSK